MHGFGSPSFSMVNAAGERFWIKYHLVCQQGTKNLADAKGQAATGKCRESHQRDLYEATERKDFCPNHSYIATGQYGSTATQLDPRLQAEQLQRMAGAARDEGTSAGPRARGRPPLHK